MRRACVHRAPSVYAAALLMLLSACSANQPPPKIESIPLSQVLNALKDELHFYLASAPPSPPTTEGCFYFKGSPAELQLKTATVTLAVVDGKQVESAAGFSVPVGWVTAGAGGSGDVKATATDTLVVPLDVVRPQPSWTPRQPQLKPDGEYKIGAALVRLREELLRVDHQRTPCLKAGKQIKLSVGFEVTKVGATDFSLKLLGLNVGAKSIVVAQRSNHLDLELELTGVLPPPPQ